MDFLTLATNQLRLSLPNAQIIRDQRSNSILFNSDPLNQIVYLKYSQRKAPICKHLAQQYILRSLHEIKRTLPYQSSGKYVLNVFVADNLNNTCYDVKSQRGRPRFKVFNMVFCTKNQSSEEIVFTILRSLSTKLKQWNRQSIKNSNKKLYGTVKERVDFLEKAANLCDVNAWRIKNKKGDGKIVV
jgi:hypothetical protein